VIRPGKIPLGRGKDAGSRIALAGTFAVHALLGGMFIAGPLTPETPPPIVYEVNLVAAPRPRPQERRAPEAVPRPADRPVAVNRRQPRRTSVSPETPPTPAPEAEAPVRTVAPEPPVETAEPSTGEDPGTVQTSGVDFPFPGYLNNLTAQVYRRWNRPDGNVALRAEVLFFIKKDGSVSNLQFVRRSGNFVFDLEAQGAIEAAANSGAFGPLPDGFPSEILPVSFFFDPESLR
jgi:protein TonB